MSVRGEWQDRKCAASGQRRRDISGGYRYRGILQTWCDMLTSFRMLFDNWTNQVKE